MFTFASSLPSYSGVGLPDQWDGQIQSVVGEFVLRIGAKTRQKRAVKLAQHNVIDEYSGLQTLTSLPELKTAGCRFLPRADWCQKSLQNDTVERKNVLASARKRFQRTGSSARLHRCEVGLCPSG